MIREEESELGESILSKTDILNRLKNGVEHWNKEKEEKENRQYIRIDLSGVDISGSFGVDKSKGAFLQPAFNLRGIDFTNVDLNGATIRNCDLSDADFLGAHLDCADLTGSHFSGARFYRTSLNEAILKHCELRGARFFDTEFRSADFGGSNLTRAEFLKCDLGVTKFADANLAGAEFPLSTPWKARLYESRGTKNDKDLSFPLVCIESIDDLIGACRDFRKQNGDKFVLFFRGEGRFAHDWELRPSIMRSPDESDYPHLRRVEGEMLNDLITQQPDAFNQLDSALGKWVLAQHYRLPTRFLDVSRDPLVGLFNACCQEEYDDEDGRLHVFAVHRSLIKPFNSDTISIIANIARLKRWEKNLLLGKTEAENNDEFHPRANDRGRGSDLMSRVSTHLYDGIRQEKPYFEKRIDIRDLLSIFVVQPQLMFERIRAQSGAFLISAFHERFEPKHVLEWNRDIPLYSHFPLRVSGCKNSILEDLRQLNLTRATLYPGIDESSKAIEERYSRRDTYFYENLTPSR